MQLKVSFKKALPVASFDTPKDGAVAVSPMLQKER